MPHAPTAAQSFPVLTFRVAHLPCAVPVGVVAEIVPIASTIRVPDQPSILEGFLNLRGEMVPVIRTALLFGLPVEAGRYTPILITKNPTLGLLVDSAAEVTQVDPAELKDLPANHAVNDCATSQFPCNGESVILIEIKKLVLREEAQRIVELRARVNHRLHELQDSAP